MIDRDNPQETATDMEIGWLAGIIEGEGSIVLIISKRNDKRQQTVRVTPKIIITNTDEMLINKSIQILTKMGIGKYVRHSKPNNVDSEKRLATGYKDITYIEITGFKRVFSLLSKILPTLYSEKKERAKLLYVFIDGRFKKQEHMDVNGSNFRYDAFDIKLMRDFIKLTKSKNKGHINRILNEYTRDRGLRSKKRLKRYSGLARKCKKQSEMVVRQLCAG